MQNVGLTLMLGMGQALGAGIEGMGNTGNGLSNTMGGASTTTGGVSTGSIDYGNTFPSGSFGYGSAGTSRGLANNRQLYL